MNSSGNSTVSLAKRLIFVFLVIWLPTLSAAERPTFADCAWGSNRQSVNAQLRASGFSSKQDEDGDVRFEGNLLGHKTVGIAFFSHEGLAKVIVRLATPDKDALGVYRRMQETLKRKYGQPQNTFRIFRSPYHDGDGYEEQAIRLGKGTLATFWDGLYMEVTDKLTVDISYEGPGWVAEMDRRRVQRDRVF